LWCRADELADLGAERVRPALAGLAAGVLLRLLGRRLGLVTPLLHVVLSPARVEAGEQPGMVALVGALEFLRDQRGGVGVVDQVVGEEALARRALRFVLAENRLVLAEDVIDEGAEKDDVAAGAERGVDIGHRRGAREARVGVDDRRRVRGARLG